MGLFSSKKITTVGTSVSRVIEDDAIPNSLANGFARNMFSEDGSQMTENMMEEMISSISLRANRFHKYGRTSYLYGLPNSSLKTSAAGRDASIAAIRASINPSAELSYYHMGGFNNLHYGWKVLVETYGYDSMTNMMTVNGMQVYLKDMQAVVTNATAEEMANGSMDQWGDATTSGKTPDRIASVQAKATPFAVDPAAQADYVRVDYCWNEQATVKVEGVDIQKTVLKTASFTIPMATYDADADYHQARYTINGKAGYWTYRAGSDTQPAVDAVFNSEYQDGGKFFPITYFRYAKTSANTDKNSQWYKQSVKMMDLINMDFDTITDAVNENPDIADVEQAMMMFAVPANTTNDMEQRYLFDFFSGIYDEMSPVVGATQNNIKFLDMNVSLGGNAQSSSIVIQDKRFKMALSYQTIIKRKVSGNIGPIGAHSSGMNKAGSTADVPMIGGGTFHFVAPEEGHWYRRQISDAVYEEVLVHGLSMKYWIFENYTTTGDDTDEILLIPLNLDIVKRYSMQDREVLYCRSMHYIFNSRVVTKLKWYQTGIFKFIMIAVTIIVTVVTYGATWQAMAAAVVAGTITVGTLIMAIAIGVLKYLAVSLILKVFVKVVGVKIAFIAAIVAAAFGMYQASTTNSIGFMPTGKELLAVSTGLSKTVSGQLQSEMGDLIGQVSEFDAYVKEQTQLLEDTQKLLDSSLHLSPMVIFGESPDDFYQRTVHSGNIGILGVEMVSSFCDVALQLPTLNDSLGDFV